MKNTIYFSVTDISIYTPTKDGFIAMVTEKGPDYYHERKF